MTLQKELLVLWSQGQLESIPGWDTRCCCEWCWWLDRWCSSLRVSIKPIPQYDIADWCEAGGAIIKPRSKSLALIKDPMASFVRVKVLTPVWGLLVKFQLGWSNSAFLNPLATSHLNTDFFTSCPEWLCHVAVQHYIGATFHPRVEAAYQCGMTWSMYIPSRVIWGTRDVPSMLGKG